MEYNKEDVLKIIKKTWVPLGASMDEIAETIIKECPECLLSNFYEIINENPVSDIPFTFKRKTFAGKKKYKIITTSLNEMYHNYHDEVPYIILLFTLCLELKGEQGFLWLHNSLQ